MHIFHILKTKQTLLNEKLQNGHSDTFTENGFEADETRGRKASGPGSEYTVIHLLLTACEVRGTVLTLQMRKQLGDSKELAQILSWKVARPGFELRCI